jgi:hypothetical protein
MFINSKGINKVIIFLTPIPIQIHPDGSISVNFTLKSVIVNSNNQDLHVISFNEQFYLI